MTTRSHVTERLYYTDPYLREFDADVVSVEQAADGRPAVILNRTAFYPSSGGQPFDTGTLGRARVVDVVDDEHDGILHVVEGEVGLGPVRGKIDWGRRFEHMQQHTGQHVLSAAFDRMVKARTLSFHLGSVSSTIDLSREVSSGEITTAEAEANRIVWEDVPVSFRFADSDEVTKLALRKEPAREGLLRLIDIEGFDLSACGGTHVVRTGAIGIIAVASWEKFRGGTRIEFLCGGRALGGYRLLRESVSESVRRLPVPPAELPAAIDRLQNDGKELKRQLKDLQGKLASFEANELAARAELRGSMRVVVEAMDGWDQNGLKVIASAIAERPSHVAVLFGSSAPSAVVVARAGDAPIVCTEVLKELTSKFGGKGGGRPELAQGGGLTGSPADFVAAARALF